MTYVDTDGEGQIITGGTSLARCHDEAEFRIVVEVVSEQARRHL